MSHTPFVYPQFTNAFAHAPWQIREDQHKNPYTARLPELLDLSDTVIDKLLKAEAVAWVLHDAKHYPDNAVAETTAVIADLIHGALEAQRKQWEKIRKIAGQKR